MLDIERSEKQKYSHQWKVDYMPSACARPMAEYILSTDLGKKVVREYTGKKQSVSFLDIGCGDGTTLAYLARKGILCHGVDITLEGLKKSQFFNPQICFEAPAWKLPFVNGQFDFTFSTDFLEHLPPGMVEASIKEILRVTKEKTFHCIATFPHVMDGVTLHLTVQPVDWWAEIFHKMNTKGVEVELMDRASFLNMMRERA
jgi:SAM-dependent methyltransferase